jgi:SAM-dependent methyltransferase
MGINLGPPPVGIKLDLACGRRKAPGHVGVDISRDTDADVVWDLRITPWPWLDFIGEPVEPVRCAHFVEHLNGTERMAFFDELWRILAPGGKAVIITPYWSSWRAVSDPTHLFPPIVEQSYLYFSRQWRQENKLGHYPIKCNFDYTYRHIYNPEVDFPDDVTKLQGVRHYLNVVDDLEVTLTRRD